MARKSRLLKVEKKYAYEFTAENGPEDFPTLSTTLYKKGDIVESDELVEHPRLKLVKKTVEPPKPEKQKLDRTAIETPEPKQPEEAKEKEA